MDKRMGKKTENKLPDISICTSVQQATLLVPPGPSESPLGAECSTSMKKGDK